MPPGVRRCRRHDLPAVRRGPPPDAPEGLCPECLLRLAWASDPSAATGPDGPGGGGAGATRTLPAPAGTAARTGGAWTP